MKASNKFHAGVGGGINQNMSRDRRINKHRRHSENVTNRANLHREKVSSSSGGSLACIKRDEVQRAIDAIRTI